MPPRRQRSSPHARRSSPPPPTVIAMPAAESTHAAGASASRFRSALAPGNPAVAQPRPRHPPLVEPRVFARRHRSRPEDQLLLQPSRGPLGERQAAAAVHRPVHLARRGAALQADPRQRRHPPRHPGRAVHPRQRAGGARDRRAAHLPRLPDAEPLPHRRRRHGRRSGRAPAAAGTASTWPRRRRPRARRRAPETGDGPREGRAPVATAVARVERPVGARSRLPRATRPSRCPNSSRCRRSRPQKPRTPRFLPRRRRRRAAGARPPRDLLRRRPGRGARRRGRSETRAGARARRAVGPRRRPRSRHARPRRQAVAGAAARAGRAPRGHRRRPRRARPRGDRCRRPPGEGRDARSGAARARHPAGGGLRDGSHPRPGRLPAARGAHGAREHRARRSLPLAALQRERRRQSQRRRDLFPQSRLERALDADGGPREQHGGRQHERPAADRPGNPELQDGRVEPVRREGPALAARHAAPQVPRRQEPRRQAGALLRADRRADAQRSRRGLLHQPPDGRPAPRRPGLPPADRAGARRRREALRPDGQDRSPRPPGRPTP